MTDINELFATDPLSLTKENLSEMIDVYRKHRSTFKLTGKAPTKAKPATDPLAKNLDLGDLGL